MYTWLAFRFCGPCVGKITVESSVCVCGRVKSEEYDYKALGSIAYEIQKEHKFFAFSFGVSRFIIQFLFTSKFQGFWILSFSFF